MWKRLNKTAVHPEHVINKKVAVCSVVVGVVTWGLCDLLYSHFKMKLAGVVLIPTLCTILAATLFLIVWFASRLTGSFDRSHPCYKGPGYMLLYGLLGALGVFLLTMLLEGIYEWNPNRVIVGPSSYVFVIDESGSMDSNDPDGLRYQAIREIMTNSDRKLPYMVYSFSSEPRILREMGTWNADDAGYEVVNSGGTAIGATTRRILADYKAGVWEGGATPKIIFLTDGAANDLHRGFLFWNDEMKEFDRVLQEYHDMGISISTVGLGFVDTELMRKMADTTGGVYISVGSAKDLAAAMETAATSYSERDLLSIRYMNTHKTLYGILRILFLSLIGSAIGGPLMLAYMDRFSMPHILKTSVIGSVAASILLELGIQRGMSQSGLWCLLWIAYAAVLGFIHPGGEKLKLALFWQSMKTKGPVLKPRHPRQAPKKHQLSEKPQTSFVPYGYQNITGGRDRSSKYMSIRGGQQLRCRNRRI